VLKHAWAINFGVFRMKETQTHKTAMMSSSWSLPSLVERAAHT